MSIITRHTGKIHQMLLLYTSQHEYIVTAIVKRKQHSHTEHFGMYQVASSAGGLGFNPQSRTASYQIRYFVSRVNNDSITYICK